ncbi:hypothetical protein NQT69_01385 [Pseudoalteromonas shioyasakiensis]|uniref:hypothetical protein n=1 Tax=Pseudoalteromonas shioyasakiensis TaxID=1190813 RepID=UPI0021195E51|nr:hypothetical protein [Pseudoalteromonas shioyasakiensis]MCQ8876685.1 hypothetical protein [Pseudoalteromonas shioyasakiensis]
MLNKLTKRFLLATLLTSSSVALAEQTDYKLMVINNEISTDALSSGELTALTKDDARIKADPNRSYEVPFNSCAANVKLNNYADAEALCTQAITLLKSSKVPSYKRNELTSFALSNRGVARIMSNKETAAISDFYEAHKMSNNDLVDHNLNRAKQNLAL